MRNLILCGMTASALIAIAACNRGNEAPPVEEGPTNVSGADAGSIPDRIRTRQANYKQIGKAMKAIGDELKGDAPSLPAIQANADRIAGFAPQILGWFPAGSGPEAGLKTRAKPEIWSDQQGFGSAAAGLITASERFRALARAGDLEAVRAALPQVQKACKQCHDRFRAPERE